YGHTLFREYFFHYPEKVWGIPTSRIHKIVAEKRVPVSGTTELIRSLIFGQSAIDHPEFAFGNYYLQNGIGEIAQFFEAGVRALGGRILTECTPVEIATDGTRATAVAFSDSRGRRDIKCSFVLTTIPLSDSIALFAGAPPDVT